MRICRSIPRNLSFGKRNMKHFCLSMHVNIDAATFMPCREQNTAVPAVMLDVFEGVHHIGDEAQAECEAEGDAGPNAARNENC
jgi:hypothetical protein